MLLDFVKETEITYSGRRYPFPEGETEVVDTLGSYITENHSELLKGGKRKKTEEEPLTQA